MNLGTFLIEPGHGYICVGLGINHLVANEFPAQESRPKCQDLSCETHSEDIVGAFESKQHLKHILQYHQRRPITKPRLPNSCAEIKMHHNCFAETKIPIECCEIFQTNRTWIA